MHKLFEPVRRRFPDPRRALPDGLVCFSDELSVDILLEAYSYGIFPWPHEESPILWFSPDPRGVLEFEDFHISKSLKKFMKRCNWWVSFDQCFDEVIESCAKIKRKGEDGTWITPHMLQNYKAFHRAGYAHSVEVWDGQKLVGGMYGVYVAGVFSGESMFFVESNASKVAFVNLVEFLKSKGLNWMDTQMVTDNIASFGGKYVGRSTFFKNLENSKASAVEIVFSET